MRSNKQRSPADRDEYYESITRIIRWIVLGLVVTTYPFSSVTGIIVLTMVVFTAVYNLLRYSHILLRHSAFGSRINSLAVDHLFVLILIVFSGGLGSPYYPLFYLLIVGTIASFGITGFAFALSSQVIITLVLLRVSLDPIPSTPEFQFTIKLVILIVFSLVAEQAVRSRDEEYLLETRSTNRAENERQRLLSLINSLTSAVLALDDHGRVYLYNAAALSLLNTNRDISGITIDTLLPVHDSSSHKIDLLHMVANRRRGINRQDLHMRASDGSTILLDITITPVNTFGYSNNNWGGYIVVFRDITKEKSLDEERDEFISVTSHELRTPLAIAEANLSTALLPNYANIDPKAKILVEQAHENIVFLSELIQDLTILSRAERNDLKVELELVDVAELVKELARDYQPQAAAKHLELTTALDTKLGSVVTSRHELREILQNFLTNAIKYTATGRITLGAQQKDNGTEIWVKDTGIGISASDKNKIFSKFYRSEDYRTRATGGTGLGLYITHKLAEKLGVVISFTSKLNHGSTFVVRVPIRKDKDAAEAIMAAANRKNWQ